MIETPHIAPMEYAQQLKKMRTERGWSQQQLAIKAGLTRDQVAKYEAGCEPPLSKFLKIMKAFGIVIFNS